MSSIPSRAILGFFACALVLPACDRPQRSMGRYIESAGLILIGDAVIGGPEPRMVLTVREVLKGNGPLSIAIQWRSCPVVPEGKGLAILLSPDWRTSEFPVVEVYTEAAAIARLRELIPAYQIPERERLNILKADPKYRDQLFDDISQMRERDNYPIVTGLYPTLDQAGRVKLIELLGSIGDARGVPVLVQALKSDAPAVRDAARAALSFYFPDAIPAGVSESRPTPESEMQKGFRLAKEGRWPEARPLLIAVTADSREAEHIRMWAALELIPHLDAGSNTRLRQSMLPLLTRMVQAGNYLQLADAVKILRLLPDRGNLDLFVQAIARTDYMEPETPFQATMALHEMGAADHARAVALLGKIAQDGAKEQGYRMTGGPPPAPLLALAWLSGETQFQQTIDIRGDYLRGVWGAGLQRDEGAFLIAALRTPGNLPPDALTWIAMRLGDLKDVRAIDALAGMLSTPQWPVAESVKAALIRIGGDTVAAAMRRLLDRGWPSSAREPALNVLGAVRGSGALPQIRAALADKSLRTTALSLLARVGTKDDLSVLVPMSDFWSGDRANHYWAMQAVGEIRARNR